MNVARSPALPPPSPKGGFSLWVSVPKESREVYPFVTSDESESVGELL